MSCLDDMRGTFELQLPFAGMFFVYFPVLFLKGPYHCWNIFILSRGLKQLEDKLCKCLLVVSCKRGNLCYVLVLGRPGWSGSMLTSDSHLVKLRLSSLVGIPVQFRVTTASTALVFRCTPKGQQRFWVP